MKKYRFLKSFICAVLSVTFLFCALPAASAQTDDLLYGDVDNDRSVTPTDALVILQSFVGLTELNETQQIVADVDGIEGVDSVDAMMVLFCYVGRLKELPYEEPVLPQLFQDKNTFQTTTQEIADVLDWSSRWDQVNVGTISVVDDTTITCSENNIKIILSQIEGKGAVAQMQFQLDPENTSDSLAVDYVSSLLILMADHSLVENPDPFAAAINALLIQIQDPAHYTPDGNFFGSTSLNNLTMEMAVTSSSYTASISVYMQ